MTRIRIKGADGNTRCKLMFLSSNPRRFRGHGGDVTISEMSHHEQAEAVWKAARPATMWGGQLRVISTHHGEGSFFNRLIGMIRKGGDDIGEWRLHRTTIDDGVAVGLVERIAEVTGRRISRAQFLKEERAACLFQHIWDEEYLCIPSSEVLTWLPYDILAPAEVEGCRIDDSSRLRYIGVDVGREHDRTVIWQIAKAGDVYWSDPLVVMRGEKFEHQESALESVLRSGRIGKCCIDITGGMGQHMAERLARRHGESVVEGVKFTNENKKIMAESMRATFEAGRIRIPKDVETREDLHSVERRVTSSGNIVFEARRTGQGHADRFWSLGLAFWGAKGYAGRIEGRLPKGRSIWSERGDPLTGGRLKRGGWF